MIQILDRNATHTLIVQGVKLTVKAFTHGEELNFLRYQAHPVFAGIAKRYEDAVEITAKKVAWIDDDDVRRFVEIVTGKVVEIDRSTIMLSDGNITDADIIKSMPYAFIVELGRAIQELSTLKEVERQD